MTKHVMLASLPIVSFWAAIAPAATQETEGAEQAANTNANTEIVCRRLAPPTGSRIGPRRICKTQHEWDLIEQEARDTLENVGNRSRAGNQGG